MVISSGKPAAGGRLDVWNSQMAVLKLQWPRVVSIYNLTRNVVLIVYVRDRFLFQCAAIYFPGSPKER